MYYFIYFFFLWTQCFLASQNITTYIDPLGSLPSDNQTYANIPSIFNNISSILDVSLLNVILYYSGDQGVELNTPVLITANTNIEGFFLEKPIVKLVSNGSFQCKKAFNILLKNLVIEFDYSEEISSDFAAFSTSAVNELTFKDCIMMIKEVKLLINEFFQIYSASIVRFDSISFESSNNSSLNIKYLISVESMEFYSYNCSFENMSNLSFYIFYLWTSVNTEISSLLLKNLQFLKSYYNLAIISFFGAELNIKDSNFDLVEGNSESFFRISAYSKAYFINNTLKNLNFGGKIIYIYWTFETTFENNSFSNISNAGSLLSFQELYLVTLNNISISQCKLPLLSMIQESDIENIDLLNLSLENIFVKETTKGNAFSQSGIINIQLEGNYNISFIGCDFVNNTDKMFAPIYLVSILATYSVFRGSNLNFLNNMYFKDLIQITALDFALDSSTISNNKYLSNSVFTLIANEITQYNLSVTDNSANLTIIDIEPYNKSLFQIFLAERILCQGNLVELFGGCYHFIPPYQGNFSLINSRIENCRSNYVSGALDVFSTLPTYAPCFYLFANVEFINNSAGLEGGASSIFFHEYKYTLTIINCRYERNYAKKGGALIFNLDDPINLVVINNCDFYQNRAESASSFSLLSGVITVQGVNFTSNYAVRGGALESMSYSEVYILNCSFYNTKAEKYGGVGLILDHSKLSLLNITVTNFSGDFGGVAYLDSKSELYINSSFFYHGKGNTGVFIYISNGNLLIYNVEILNISSENSVWFLDSSEIDLEIIKIESTVSTIFDINNAIGTFREIKISSAVCINNAKAEGCVFSVKETSNIGIFKLILTNVESSIKGAAFYLVESSKIQMNAGDFSNIIDSKSGAFLYIDYSIGNFANITVFNASNDLVYGHLCYLFFENLSFHNPENFISKLSYINIDSCILFSLKSCIFNNLSSNTYGGLVYFSNEEEISLQNLIANSFFSNIIGQKGGVIFNENTYLEINGSFFINNTGIEGGSIYSLCYDGYADQECYLILYNNSFIDNYASTHGGAIKWSYKKPLGIYPISENLFVGNKAGYYGNDIASFPIKLAVRINSDSISYTLEQTMKETLGPQIAKSGEKLDFLMEFFLIDEEDQIIKEIDQAKIYIDIVTDEKEYAALLQRFDLNLSKQDNNYSSNFTDIAGQTSQNINETTWSFFFDDLTITAKPSTLVFLKVTSLEITKFRQDLFPSSYPLNHFDLDETKNLYAYYIPIQVNSCVEGEIYDNLTNTCYKCPKATYSYYIFDESCSNCLDHTECHGGNDLVVEKGYWRSSNTSENIYRCTAMLYLCEGGVNSECLDGYTGKLCEVCEDINGNKANKNYFGLCQECADVGINILISIPMMIGVLIILKLLVNFFLKRGEIQNLDCALIKLLIIHYQMLTLIPNVNTTFGQTPNQILGGLTRNWFSYDCIFSMVFEFQSELNSRMLSLTILLVLFFIFSNFALLKWKKEYWDMIKNHYLYLKKFVFRALGIKNRNQQSGNPTSSKLETPTISIVKKYHSDKEDKDQITIEILTYNSVWIYLIQSSMLDLAFLGMRCIEIDGVSYNRYSLNYECWTSDHILWIIFLYVPNILLWSVVVTWAMYKCLLKVKKINKKSFIIASVGFKKKYQLKGDIMNLLRKSIVIIINTFSNENSETIPFTIFLLISFLLLFHFYTRPYNYKILNHLDAFSLYIVFSTYYTLSYYYTSIDESLAVFFYSLLIIMHIIFALLWCTVFLRKPIKMFINRFILKKNKGITPIKKST